VSDVEPARGAGGDPSRRRFEAPTLETERLVLRAFRADDLAPLARMWAAPEVVRFIGGTPLTREDTWRRSLAACGQWPYTGFGYWVAELKSDRRVVGQIGFADFKRDMQPSLEGEPELGYVFDPSVHGQGIALEACKAALDWADSTLGAQSYPAIIGPGNAASIRLAEKLGFVREPDGTYRGEDIAIFRRTRR
jgi:RimJ/RimL family protein N-acetyltransferase